MKDRFEQIYKTNEWGHGSGEGSLPVHTKGYVNFINKFLKKYSIKSVVDLGCGDWQFSRFINWREALYVGYDLVEQVITFNKAHFSSDKIRFFHYSGDVNELPSADLLIAKDVLQHWSNETVAAFLPQLGKYRYSLLTNCVNPGGVTDNKDILDGEFRPLELRRPPFLIAAEEVYSFTNKQTLTEKYIEKSPIRWLKRTLLVKQPITKKH
ncbi:MAG: glycosyl transferase [Gammaproteobacteria bacterium]|nr:MAG: glycosyl transferase [Gammaproteobacteria bacterium]